MDKLDSKYQTFKDLQIQDDKELLALGDQKLGSTAEFEQRLNRDVPLVRVSYPFNHPKTFLQQENGRQQLIELLSGLSDHDKGMGYKYTKKIESQEPKPTYQEQSIPNTIEA